MMMTMMLSLLLSVIVWYAPGKTKIIAGDLLAATYQLDNKFEKGQQKNFMRMMTKLTVKVRSAALISCDEACTHSHLWYVAQADIHGRHVIIFLGGECIVMQMWY